MKMTFQPKNRQRNKVHGFRARMSTPGRKKGTGSKKSKRKKEIIRIGRSFVAFFSFRKIGCRMNFSESLKKNQDFQSVYRKGQILCQ